MKKIIIVLLLVPIALVIVGLSKYSIQLNSFFAQDTNSQVKNKQATNNTEVHIVGTVHFETDLIKRHHLYSYLDSISPSVILYEGDSSTVKRIAKKTDYFARVVDAFKSGNRLEKPAVLKYLKNNPNCTLLPYEWELRNKYHRKHKLRKKSKEMINSVISLYSDKLLNEDQALVISRFLELNKKLIAIEKKATLASINNIDTDEILKNRQHYIYTKIPEIATSRKELVKFSDFVPIHTNYWDIRNNAMVQNILKQVRHNPNKTIVVLNGFYHRYYLIQELQSYQDEYNFSLK
ncbi:hypothetical protein ABN763_14775 [Spongiivirga sp. MCCC 1A20706]|uniref:hypothetical protein n=1 Tax=Spongiivirga sp. MCCC 1A20706 TaxID=3160963 RepID=UPI0039777CDC